MGNLQALGVQELSCQEQRALVGGDGMIAKIIGRVVGAVGAAVMNIVDATVGAAGDFADGFGAGYAEARG